MQGVIASTTTLKDSLHDNVHKSEIPMKHLADVLGISYSYLANAVNPACEDHHFQLRHLIPTTLQTGRYDALDHIEFACGRVAFKLPQATGNMQITSNLLHIIKHIGELSGKIEEILADGRIKEHEAKDVEPLIIELTSLLVRLASLISGAVEK